MDVNSAPRSGPPGGARGLARVLLFSAIAPIWLVAYAVRLGRAAARLGRDMAGRVRQLAPPAGRLARRYLVLFLLSAFAAGLGAGAWLGARAVAEAPAPPAAASDPAAGPLVAPAGAVSAAPEQPAPAGSVETSEPQTAEAPGGVPAGAGPPPPGSLTWPVRGEVLVPYGWAYSRLHGDWRFHPGIDIRSAPDMPFVAALAGVVAEVTHTPGDGFTVVLAHGPGVETVYAGLHSVVVRPGLPVEAGEELGRVGMGPRSEADAGAHLHFEVRVDGEPVDPAPLLTGR